MKAAYVGLWLSLMSGVAMAQAAPSGAPTTPAPAQQGAATAPGAPQDGGMNAQMQHPAGDPNGGPDEQYEGEIIQTPNGTYMVSEPQRNGEPLRPRAEGDDMEPPGRTGWVSTRIPVIACRLCPRRRTSGSKGRISRLT